MSRQRSSSPDLFTQDVPAQRRRLIVLDSDEETQDVPFQNGQNLLTDENFETPPSPPARVSPTEDDYLVRVEREIRQREDDEYAEQLLTPGYMRILRDMHEEIDAWLENNGGVVPFPNQFKRFMRHNWCVRKLPRKDRIRINKLRLRYDMILEEEDEQFWRDVEINEPAAREMSPSCSICRYDIRNQMFTVHRLSCGHLFHKMCMDRHLVDNQNPRCPNCNAYTNNAGERVHLNFL